MAQLVRAPPCHGGGREFESLLGRLRWGLSSAGRASALQAEGHRFEPCRPHLLNKDGFPSGQRGQTVNLLATPSKVRILLHPANLALTSLRCRSYFFVQKENRKGAAKPRPLCTPLGLFLECLTVAGGRVLTCACMLRLFRVERCADGAPWAP